MNYSRRGLKQSEIVRTNAVPLSSQDKQDTLGNRGILRCQHVNSFTDRIGDRSFESRDMIFFSCGFPIYSPRP